MTHSRNQLRLLAISGSIRTQSVNTAVLRAAAALAPKGTEVLVYRGLAELPHFNPDLDTEHPPAAVAALRSAVRTSRGLLISSPEYAHGVPGVMKNALDWLVSYEGFIHMPVALINARPGATWALASLKETLSAMNARIIEAASVTLPLSSNRLDEAALTADREVAALLRLAVGAMIRATTTEPGRLR